jgi:predicted NBD/HSP70 family sugar kinase
MPDAITPGDGQSSAVRVPRPRGALRSLREANLRHIVEVISRDGGLSQAEVARRTELSAATVSNLVAELRNRGLVRRREARGGGHGGLELVGGRSSGVVVGVDFGHRHITVGIADTSGRLLAEDHQPLPPEIGAEESCAEAWAMATRLLDHAGISRADVLQVGVGLPGPIDPVSGRVGWGAILHRWAGQVARTTLEDAFGLPVVVDNDGNLGALGELRHGAGRGCTDLVCLNLATGVGAGLIIGGRVHHGAAGTAGEIGHITIDEHGQLCRCGNRGCLETVVGVDNILEMLRHSYGEKLDVPRVLALADQGDARCRRALADAGRAVGIVVADLCNLLSPQRIVVGGELRSAGELILGPLRETVAQRAVPAAAAAAEIVPSMLGDRAELIGAICLALDAVGASIVHDALSEGMPAGD